MSHEKEARLILAGDELRAVENSGISFQNFAHAALREAVDDLMDSLPEAPEEPEEVEDVAPDEKESSEEEESSQSGPKTAAQKEAAADEAD